MVTQQEHQVYASSIRLGTRLTLVQLLPRNAGVNLIVPISSGSKAEIAPCRGHVRGTAVLSSHRKLPQARLPA